jgi:hypothetical protein
MLVTVECSVSPSKLRLLAMVLPIIAGAMLLYFLGSLWLSLAFLVAMLVMVKPVLLECHQPDRLRFNSSSFMCWTQQELEHWHWEGNGRLSHAFVQFDLANDANEVWRLRIWKDSVTEPSWRALNMAYRVNQNAAKAELDGQ